MDMDGRYEPPPSPGLPDDAGPGEGPCQECGADPGRVNSYMWVMSFVILTRHAKYDACLCRRCATRVGLTELGKSAVLGWWGIPWGILTFQALWIDLRSLSRWSRVPRAALLAIVLAIVAAPVAGVVYLVRDEQETARAKATGDWADPEVVAWVDQGHARWEEEKYREALDLYLKAHAAAPQSSIINFSIARCYVALGDYAAALRYARTAESRNPENPGHVAYHGWLLLETGDLEGARERARKTATMRIDEPFGAGLVLNLLWEVEDWDALDRVAAAASKSFPDRPEFPGWRLLALVGKDDLAGFETLWGSLPEEGRKDQSAALAHVAFRFRNAPSEGMTEFLATWKDLGLDATAVRFFTRIAERVGFLDEARRRVLLWLADPETPGRLWHEARAFLPPDRWGEELDSYLDRRSDPEPLYLRITSLDPVDDRARIAELARRGRESPTPLGLAIDSIYAQVSRALEPAESWIATMGAHVAEHPDHDSCRLNLGFELMETDPKAARSLIDAPLASDNPGLAAFRRLVQVELLVVEGRFGEAGEALAGGDRVDDDTVDRARVLTLEIALGLRDDGSFDRTAAALAESGADEARAAALVIGWARQAAEGKAPSYRQDVDAWLARANVEAARKCTSASAQAILLLEGKTDRATAARALGTINPSTLPFVRLLKESETSGRVDRSAFGRLVQASKQPYDWATRLSRMVHERRSA